MGRKASSCADCLAWGVLNNGRCCSSCSVWRHHHPGESGCTGCGRILAVKDGYCRLCWQQARYQSRIAGGLPRGAVSVLQDGERLPYQQLFFDRLQVRRPHSPVRQHGRCSARPKPPPSPAGRPSYRWIQPRLFEAWRDFTLFAFCKKRKTIFRSPVQGIPVGERTGGIIQPLSQDEVDQAAGAATTPAARLVLVLAAMHAARFKAIRELLLDDIDLGNRRIVIGGRARPLDDLTRRVVTEWLAYRNTRWPTTANLYLLVNQMSANGTGPVSRSYFASTSLCGKAVTLERLRVDRQLQEALAHGPDPLHLAAMFGLDPKTAIRYADNARQLLVTAAEEQNPAGSEEEP